MALAFLECSRCAASHDAERLQNLSPCCQAPLLARYDLERVAAALPRERLQRRAPGLWKYAEALPVQHAEHRLTLGEGGTPLLPARRLARAVGVRRLWLKDESRNPTGSFKARGACVAVSRARELGATALALPSAGNAGSAAAAYAAAAGLPLHVAIPRDTPATIRAELRALGAQILEVDGLLDACGATIASLARTQGWFELATFKEPYRLEGKKTMGFELAEQLGWRWPDAIVYPTGGGLGLVALWKACEEAEALGWTRGPRPRLFAVQADGCAPFVRAWEMGWSRAEPWPDARTIAWGLRVPRSLGDALVLQALRQSEGAGVTVGDDDMRRWVERLGAATGLYTSWEGAAAVAAVPRLRDLGLLQPTDEVVVFLTGSGLKYGVDG